MRHSAQNKPGSKSLLFLAVFILLLLGGVFLGYKLGLFAPRKFGEADRFNLAVVTPNYIRLVSLETDGQSATVITFPADIYVPDVAHGYGSYLLGKVYDVGQLDKRGGEVLMKTVRELVGAPVDGYVVLPQASDNFLQPDFILESPSNLALMDRARFAWGFSQVRQDRKRQRDTGDITEKLLLPDGTEGQIVEPDRMDAFLGDSFVEDKIQDEDLRVHIVNTTPYPGLGNKAGRIVEALGGSVVAVDSIEETVNQCQLTSRPEVARSATVKRLTSIFNCQVAAGEQDSRADLKLVLGTAYVAELTQ